MAIIPQIDVLVYVLTSHPRTMVCCWDTGHSNHIRTMSLSSNACYFTVIHVKSKDQKISVIENKSSSFFWPHIINFHCYQFSS